MLLGEPPRGLTWDFQIVRGQIPFPKPMPPWRLLSHSLRPVHAKAAFIADRSAGAVIGSIGREGEESTRSLRVQGSATPTKKPPIGGHHGSNFRPIAAGHSAGLSNC